MITLLGPSIWTATTRGYVERKYIYMCVCVCMCVIGACAARLCDRRSLARIDVVREMASNTPKGALSRGRIGSN